MSDTGLPGDDFSDIPSPGLWIGTWTYDAPPGREEWSFIGTLRLMIGGANRLAHGGTGRVFFPEIGGASLTGAEVRLSESDDPDARSAIGIQRWPAAGFTGEGDSARPRPGLTWGQIAEERFLVRIEQGGEGPDGEPGPHLYGEGLDGDGGEWSFVLRLTAAYVYNTNGTPYKDKAGQPLKWWHHEDPVTGEIVPITP